MSELVTKYKVFLASPSDLLDERSSIDQVISELNQAFYTGKNITLELVKWETHSAPGISKDGPQDVINKDIGSDYDIFIGLLWTKFGMPTETAGSGTEEEFTIAYDKFLEDSNSIQILFYFRTSAPKSLSDIDPEQLAQVRRFKDSLGKMGTFFWEYGTVEELHRLLRIHIPKRINQLIDQVSESSGSVEQQVAESQDVFTSKGEIADELGLVDYQEIIEDSFANSTKGIEGIGDSLAWLAEEIEKKSEEGEKFSNEQLVSKKASRDFFRRTAKIINDFADRIDPDINIFISNFEEGADAISKLINIQKNDFPSDDQEDFNLAFNGLKEMDEEIINTVSSMNGLRKVVHSLPRMERELNRARRNVESKLELLVRSMETALVLSSELQKELQ